jgi:hypothetical protein
MAVSTTPTQDTSIDGSTDVLETIRSRHRVERRQITDEQRALNQFAEKVGAISIPTDEQQSIPALTTTSTPSLTAQTGSGLAAVRDAYESTVMSVPHYADEYGDTYAESVAEEFGPTVGTTLVEGSRFDGQCRAALLAAVERALAERTLLLDALNVEQESIADVGPDLSSVVADVDSLATVAFDEQDFGGLDAYRARLAVLSEKCDVAATRRQQAIREQRHDLQLPADAPDIPTYLYRACEPRYPVLSLIARVGDTIDRLRRDVETAITTCH